MSGRPRGPDSIEPDLAEGDGRSHLLGALRAEGAKGVAIATTSTVVFVVLVVVLTLHSANWLVFKQFFFNGRIFRDSFPDIASHFWRNVEWFLIAEPIILILALVLAVMRSLPGPVFFPIRALAIMYIDIFRGLPTILVILMLGFGVPALQIPGLPTQAVFWGIVALILSYSAYVAEVYRAGIESIHPSQTAAARSLGLSRIQTLRFVVVPQAVRRVIPPLLNDFIGLQKDTVLVSFIGVVEIFRIAEIKKAATFNFTPYIGVALVFIVVTIPLARLTDWLVARDKRQRAAGRGR